MKHPWRWFASITVWWVGVFAVQRLLFLVLSRHALTDVPWKGILLSFWKGLPMDLSATGYLMLATSLMLLPVFFKPWPWPVRAANLSIMLFLASCALITAADAALFHAWGSRIDRKALGYLAFPKEAMAGMRLSGILMLTGLTIAQVWALARIRPRLPDADALHGGTIIGRTATAVLVPGLFLIAARGGPQDDPINKSWVYFSRHSVLNLAATNGLWNFLEVLAEPPMVDHNPYSFLPPEEAEHEFTKRSRKGVGPYMRILGHERPNILVVLLESWSADIIEPLGGDSGVAPQFTRLAKDGLLFTNFHSTGFRTEQGLCALISAFPSQPKTTIIRNFGKFDRLPSIVRPLSAAGYHSTYWYAGNIEFANTRAYLEAMGFDRIHDERSFPSLKRTDWGAFDEELFAFHLREAGRDPKPFFHVLMTSTSHEPFDAPVDEGFPGTSEPQRYRNTVHYTDRCLGAFLDSARTKDWYANTLVVVLADHGHYLPHYLEQSSAARHRIPLLLTGGALRDELRGRTDSTWACHTDLAATLLAQTGLPHAEFEWSRDIFDRGVPHVAFWTFNEGFGIADSVQTVVYDAVRDRVAAVRDTSRTTDRDRLLRDGQVRLQILLDRYIGTNQ